MDNKEKEKFLEWFAEVTKQDRETHSNQLKYVSNSLENLNGYGKVYKVLKTDFGFTVALITFLVSVLSPYFLIKNDISLINLNVNNVKEDMKEVKNNVFSVKESTNDLNGRVSNIEGRLNAKTLK